MALYQPGKRSTITFLISSIFTITLLIIIITGHLLIAFDLWFYFTKDTGMEAISAFTGLPEALLWLIIVAAFIMDVWIVISMRKDRQKIKRR